MAISPEKSIRPSVDQGHLLNEPAAANALGRSRSSRIQQHGQLYLKREKVRRIDRLNAHDRGGHGGIASARRSSSSPLFYSHSTPRKSNPCTASHTHPLSERILALRMGFEELSADSIAPNGLQESER
jgi:hypothetical protein